MSKTKVSFKKRFQRTDFTGLSVFGRGQHFDWEVLMAFFLLVIIIAISFSVHVFLGEMAGDIFQINDKSPAHNDTINKNSLDQIVSSFAARADNLEKLQTQKPVFVDPSL